ncbi:ChrR family anti-sigma-E factor [Vibrio neptunius]|uniref:Cupin domain-containing protein n=1 Tax=Vibrio neptunius TaxID=170651 RepID=A0ABS2ZWF4_9VIBR|nr:ChrR family anti-sigma-E factor [Vibrio neptunius]MBN3491460.1 cupin domain-containing protein [Vibrio neptunius]MBN3513798.1 cupin domain-containing protein [Vibrio neptunius]MBN3548139.1 cupin domain-containing protein [Vibrio neptunius]MBN3576274.1 cupin domain-containing protein [Vibrio neptunius]MCH9869938.1 cupin domain-containing protein [Vibrio neptunius]
MSYHPNQHMLQAYVEGSLDAVDGFTVATHLESCPSCKKQVLALESLCGEALMETDVFDDSGFDSMLNDILSTDPAPQVVRLTRKPSSIEVNGKTFQLPLSLTRFRDKVGEWKNYGGKVFSAPVDMGNRVRVNLMYIAEDVKIPQHTHRGMESTLILHGGFSDEDGHYEAGDYLVKDASIKHSPYTQKGEDCLCITVLTEPMIFTQGVARIFNMFGKGMYP